MHVHEKERKRKTNRKDLRQGEWRVTPTHSNTTAQNLGQLLSAVWQLTSLIFRALAIDCTRFQPLIADYTHILPTEDCIAIPLVRQGGVTPIDSIVTAATKTMTSSFQRLAIDLSQKFWSGEKIGPGDKNNGPPRPFSPKNLVWTWNNGPSTSTMFDRNCRLWKGYGSALQVYL